MRREGAVGTGVAWDARALSKRAGLVLLQPVCGLAGILAQRK